jgi:hypothetical protein
MGGDEAEDGNESEQQDEDDEGDPIDVGHGNAPDLYPEAFPFDRQRLCRETDVLFLGHEINDGGQNGSDDHPEHLIPVEKWNADPGWVDPVIEGDPKTGDELEHKQQVPPVPAGVGTSGIAVSLIHLSPVDPCRAIDQV